MNSIGSSLQQFFQEGFFSFPGTTSDWLYPSSYDHKHRHPGACTICQEGDSKVCEVSKTKSCQELGCDKDLLLHRSRNQTACKPFLHFGRFSSGDFVIKSGKHRDDLAYKEKLLAFEMEGAGLWDHLPTLVVKSICDYADSHKNKHWQNYAAYAASTCVKAMLRVWRKAEIQLHGGNYTGE